MVKFIVIWVLAAVVVFGIMYIIMKGEGYS